MSVNLTLTFRVAGLKTEATEPVLAAIGGVLRQRQIADDVVLSCDGGEIQGVTPYPMIISRSYEWCPEVEAEITAVIAELAPGATAEFTWESPDG